MKFARVTYQGDVVEAREESGQLRLSNGLLVAETEVQWLPPMQFKTIFALGLNYAAHAKEIDFSKAPTDPLVFLKGQNTLTGHRSTTRRPADVKYMHYECELAVVIGKTCKHVSADRAYEVVRGYTVANDYAIRDYLENYYRPNLRVKNRDACTPIGPWLVDAEDVPDPMNLRLQTRVNGHLTQDGNTSDMVFGVAWLIAYLSSFMTLNVGDVILTGTPEGVTDSRIGDEVVTEIEQVGRLVNTIVGDESLPLPN
jgi:5-oxopent-3-ene-1,2,5-tricarboxylate decarboxylase/2-hydroxyhepta-2,4-diene-1,7-dioate isomerase